MADKVSLETIGLLLLLSVMGLFFQFRLWRFLVSKHSENYRSGDLLPSFLAGFTLRLMIPGGHAEITKIFLLKGKKRGKAIAFGIEKFFQTTLKVILITAVLPFFFSEQRLWLWGLSILFSMLILFFPLLLKHPRFSKYQEKEVRYWRIFAGSFLYNIPIFTLMTSQYFIMLNTLGDISFIQTAAVAVFIWGAGLLPISISGLGVRENLAVFFLSAYGFSNAAAMGVALFIFFINAILPALVGIVVILKRKHDLKDAGVQIKNFSKSVYQKNRKKTEKQLD